MIQIFHSKLFYIYIYMNYKLIIGNNGLKGNKGYIGLKGLNGNYGKNGKRGQYGENGFKGEKGNIGDNGSIGLKGNIGLNSVSSNIILNFGAANIGNLFENKNLDNGFMFPNYYDGTFHHNLLKYNPNWKGSLSLSNGYCLSNLNNKYGVLPCIPISFNCILDSLSISCCNKNKNFIIGLAIVKKNNKELFFYGDTNESGFISKKPLILEKKINNFCKTVKDQDFNQLYKVNIENSNQLIKVNKLVFNTNDCIGIYVKCYNKKKI